MSFLSSGVSAPDRYSPTAIAFHWLLAILIPGMVGLGWYMLTVEETPVGPWYLGLHKSVGIAVGLVVLLRLLWRLGHRPAPLPISVPRWQVNASKVSHWLLYTCMLAMPAFGLGGTLFSHEGIAFFGVPIPPLVIPDKAISEVFFSVHAAVAWILVSLVALHVLAALKHRFIAKDAVFQRMWFS